MHHTAAELKLPRVVGFVSEASDAVRAAKLAGRSIGFVPTMGALHAGHLSLIERSRQQCDFTVVSIFVNPKQFSPGEDFLRYPRNLEADLEMLAALDVDLVFVPTADEMYPPGYSTQVQVTGLTNVWEGAARPTHFAGVTTVVLKLFQIIPADRAYFGQKDYQQSLVVQRMVADLNVPIGIVVCPTFREPDGLALSSRNRYLTADERQQATVLSESLRLAREMFDAGERDARKLQAAIRQTIAGAAKAQLDYAAVVDPKTLDELSHIDSSAVVLLAARFGSTRLIDNELLGNR